MGAVIGHEMTHGFDDQGRKFDGQGNRKDWWTEADAKEYVSRADRVVAQYDNYIAVDSLHLNGKLTLGENIADIGGLKIAYTALQRALAGKPRPGLIDGFTPEQRFFLGWAQVWRQQNRPENARVRVATDPHSSPLWRVNGPLSDLPEFAKAFGCKAGDPMIRPDSTRAEIW
jgi:putative endopeptidase